MAANTGYGYVERRAEDQINWSAVATQFNETLKGEFAAREAKKAALDESARQMQLNLQNAPSGDYIEANEFATQFAADGSATMLAANRALKAGILQPRQYSLINANLQDSTNKVFGMAKQYQAAYTEKKERLGAMDPSKRSQALEAWKMEQAEGLFNIKNTKALVNQNNGMVSLGHWENGKMDGDPSSFMTVNQLTGALNEKFDYFDIDAQVKSDVDGLGMIDDLAFNYSGQGGLETIIKTSSQGGKFAGDKELLKDYQEWLDLTSDEMMVNPLHVSSILTEQSVKAPNGKDYTFTYDETEFKAQKADGNLIYVDRTNSQNGELVFKDEQEGVVKGVIKEKFNSAIDKKINVQASRKGFKPKSVVDGEKETKKDESTLNMLSSIYYGNSTDIDAAETYFRDNIQNASKVNKIGDQIVVTFTNGDTKTVDLVDAQGNPLGFEQFAKSATLLTGVSNIDDSVDIGGGKKSGVVDSVASGEEGTVVVTFADGRKETRKGKITDEFYVNLDNELNKTNPDKSKLTLEYTSISQGTGKGAETFTSETSSEQVNRYYDEKITSDLFDEKTDDATANKLKTLLGPLGFKVTIPYNTANKIYLNKEGMEQVTLYTNNTESAEIKSNLEALLNAVKGNTSEAEAKAQESFLTDQVGTITGESKAGATTSGDNIFK